MILPLCDEHHIWDVGEVPTEPLPHLSPQTSPDWDNRPDNTKQVWVGRSVTTTGHCSVVMVRSTSKCYVLMLSYMWIKLWGGTCRVLLSLLFLFQSKCIKTLQFASLSLATDIVELTTYTKQKCTRSRIYATFYSEFLQTSLDLMLIMPLNVRGKTSKFHVCSDVITEFRTTTFEYQTICNVFSSRWSTFHLVFNPLHQVRNATIRWRLWK